MYDALSKYYDALSDGDYYAKWFDYVENALTGRTVGADVGCGSGAFTVELARRGKDITGFDVSDGMLKAAFERSLAAGIKPRFVKADAASFRTPRPVDFVIAMNDVVNYMKDPRPFFESAHAALKDGGLLLFDVSSESKLLGTIAGNTFCLKGEGVTCVWESSKPHAGRLDYTLDFFALRDDGLYERSVETQTQYIHSADKLTDALSACGFKVRTFGDMTRRSPKENAQRLHFEAIKKA